MTMQRAMVVRRERLNEHIASVRQWHRSYEEATLTARLRCAESNMQNLERFAELEHNTAKSILAEGRQFYVYVEVSHMPNQTPHAATLVWNFDREVLNQHKLAVGERYRTEFVAGLSSVPVSPLGVGGVHSASLFKFRVQVLHHIKLAWISSYLFTDGKNHTLTLTGGCHWDVVEVRTGNCVQAEMLSN
eukprot:929721-Amphidinium_carterae.1